MTLAKQISDNESIRLKFLKGEKTTVRDIRESLQSEADVRQQCDLMAEVIFALIGSNQQLRRENERLLQKGA